MKYKIVYVLSTCAALYVNVLTFILNELGLEALKTAVPNVRHLAFSGQIVDLFVFVVLCIYIPKIIKKFIKK